MEGCGANGRDSDGGVWSKCSLANNLANGNVLNLPPPKCLPFGMEEVPALCFGIWKRL